MAKKSGNPKQPNFEESLKELEKIVSKLESGKLGLAESLDQYEQGVSHLKQCYNLLEYAEKRIEMVTGIDREGGPEAEAFDVDEGESLDEKRASRGKLRSRATKQSRSSEVDDDSSLF